MKKLALVASLALVVVASALFIPQTVAADASERCFAAENPAVTNCISGIFKTFWEGNGGLSVFGYPLTAPTTERLSSGNLIQVQWFERVRMELRGEGQTPQLATLGETLLQRQGRDWQAQARSQSKSSCQYIEITGRNLCEPFLSYYKRHGLSLDRNQKSFSAAESQALFGLPLTEAAEELDTDGKVRLVQWFQRARLELHPEMPPAAQVLGGRVGFEALATQVTQSTAVCSALPPSQGVAYIGEVCLRDSNRFRTVFSLSGYKSSETVAMWLFDSEGNTIGTQFENATNRCDLVTTVVSLSTIGRCKKWLFDPSGNASGIQLDANALYPSLWTLVIQPTSTKQHAMVFFEVAPTAVPVNDFCAGVPPSVSATVAPTCVDRGDLYKLTANGFTAGEEVTLFVTGPDKVVEPIISPYPYNKRATAGGNMTLIAVIPDGGLRGDYYVTIVGTRSGHQAIGVVRKR